MPRRDREDQAAYMREYRERNRSRHLEAQRRTTRALTILKQRHFAEFRQIVEGLKNGTIK